MSDEPDTCVIVECTSFDDLSKIDHLVDSCLTVMLPPNIAGPVFQTTRNKYPSWHFGILGWEGTLNECLSWTAEQGVVKIVKAIEMGYDPVFRPPNGVWDPELVGTLNALGGMGANIVTINNPNSKPCPETLSFYPGSPDHGKGVSIVNVSDDLVVNPDVTYGLAGFESVLGDPHATAE